MICTMKTSVASLLFATVATRTSAFAPASRSAFSRWVVVVIDDVNNNKCCFYHTHLLFVAASSTISLLATCPQTPYLSPMAPCPSTEFVVNGGASTPVTKRPLSLSRPSASSLMSTCLKSRLHLATPLSTVWSVAHVLTSSSWLLWVILCISDTLLCAA